MIWILLGMIFIWAILLITSMIVAENGNKKAFTYLFSGFDERGSGGRAVSTPAIRPPTRANRP